ncbi:hypothetical protein NEOLEDRAFT_1180227 [Neolentinus lepideus HHB14362 ss-1]|uniref:Uncharacterized protein n=1 Tax=Neolentinus lepideus HHB14362 ss-1 TaxID=1314782 RepID=A0A165R6M8_9AGAM|nr:hypothetical protein NEOLEDRAFT_1180227 [Neolentinus lepideus HHB14362 ss-1]
MHLKQRSTACTNPDKLHKLGKWLCGNLDFRELLPTLSIISTSLRREPVIGDAEPDFTKLCMIIANSWKLKVLRIRKVSADVWKRFETLVDYSPTEVLEVYRGHIHQRRRGSGWGRIWTDSDNEDDANDPEEEAFVDDEDAGYLADTAEDDWNDRDDPEEEVSVNNGGISYDADTEEDDWDED